MLKKSVTFEDYNGDQQTETLYFNLTKTEMIDMVDLLPRLQKWENVNASNMTQEDTLEFFNIIKDLVGASYGVRSEDGKFFRKSPELFKDFEASAMYDAFVFNFISNPDQALEFMVGILPKGLDDEALAKAQSALTDYQKAEINAQVVELPQPAIEEAVDMDTRPAWVKEDREPTKAELGSMTSEQLQEAFKTRFTRQ